MVSGLARFMDRSRFDIHVCFLYGEAGPIAGELAEVGVPVHMLGLRSSRDVLKMGRLRALLRRLEPDLVHDHDLLLWPAPFLSRSRARHIGHLHVMHKPSLSVKRLGFKALIRPRVHRWVAVSEAVRGAALRALGIRPEQCDVVSNGIDPEWYGQLPDREQARRQFGLEPGLPVAGFVGRLDCGTKGPEEFLEIVSRLPKEWHGLLVGGGGLIDNLGQLSQSLGLDGRVTFAGLLGDVRPAYAAFDYLLVLSKVEPFGLVAIEGLAAGKPVLAFDCPGGMREVLEGTGAVIVTDRDVGGMAEELLALHSDPSRAQQIASKGRERVLSRFTVQQQANEMGLIYERELGHAT